MDTVIGYTSYLEQFEVNYTLLDRIGADLSVKLNKFNETCFNKGEISNQLSVNWDMCRDDKKMCAKIEMNDGGVITPDAEKFINEILLNELRAWFGSEYYGEDFVQGESKSTSISINMK